MGKFIRHLHIAEKIIFVDGLWGTGKSILGPVLGSFRNVEKQRLEHIYEYLCTLYNFKKIDSDAAVTLMRLYADLALFNSMISREVNLRITDDSGLLNNPNSLAYIIRLFYKDGDVVLERIKHDKPIVQIMTHQVLPVIDLAFKAYGDRLRIVEMVRHPLYLIEHWFNYIERCGQDPREFTLWIDFNSNAIPWFARGWEEKYVQMKTMDKVIYSINWLTKRIDETYRRVSKKEQEQILLIPFEKFVTDPWPYMEELERVIGSEMTASSQKVLKRQKCPRRSLNAGRGHKHYGWKKEDKNTNDADDYKRRKKIVESRASSEAIELLKELSNDYEKKYQLFTGDELVKSPNILF